MGFARLHPKRVSLNSVYNQLGGTKSVLHNTWNSITDDCRNCGGCILAYDVKINGATSVIYSKSVSWVSDETQLKITRGLMEVGSELDSKGTGEILKSVVCKRLAITAWPWNMHSSGMVKLWILTTLICPVFQKEKYGQHYLQWETSMPAWCHNVGSKATFLGY